MKIGDKVQVTNIRGDYESKVSDGRIMGLSIYIGQEGVVTKATENKCFDAVVEFPNGDTLAFKESELIVIK